MAEVEVFQLHMADGVGIAFYATISIVPIAKFRFHVHRENVLLFKKGIQRRHDLGQSPALRVHGRENGDQHIGVVADCIQVKMILVVIMVLLKPVQLLLQGSLHLAVGFLRTQHGIVLGGIAAGCQTGTQALNHHGTGGHHIQQKCSNQRYGENDQKPLSVPHHICSCFLSIRCGLGCCPCHSGGGIACRRASRFGGHVLPLDLLLLPPFGNGVAGGILHFRFGL